MLTRIAWSLAILTATTLALASPAAAQIEKAGVVTTLQGTATVARAGRPDLAPLKFKDEVFLRDRITTGDNSVARILLGGKAIVTVRERSVLTITEAPGTATVEMGLGRMALAVIKERMKPGESIEIRTPNAIAGIRGTVVITEVEQATAQLGGGATGYTTTFTNVRGTFDVAFRDTAGRPAGNPVTLTQNQQTRVLGLTPPRPPITLSPDAVQRLNSSYQPKVQEAPPAANSSLVTNQMSQGLAEMDRFVKSTGGPAAAPGGPSGQTSSPRGEESSSAGGSSGPATTVSATTGTSSTTGGQQGSGGSGGSGGATGSGGAKATVSTPTIGGGSQGSGGSGGSGGSSSSGGSRTAATPVTLAPTVVAPPAPPPPPPLAPVVRTPAPVVVPIPTSNRRVVDAVRENESNKNKKR